MTDLDHTPRQDGKDEDDAPHGATETIDRVRDKADERASDGDAGEGKVTIGELLDSFGHRTYGPFLLVPALLEISPIGGIPGVPTFLALIIVIFAVQMLMGREHFWLPGFIQKRSIGVSKIDKADDKMHPVTERMDRWFGGRLKTLTGRQAIKTAALCCILLALTVPPLEIIPFASTAPMAAIAAFGLALIMRDGLVMAIAFALTVVAFGVGIWSLVSGGGSGDEP